MTLKTENLPNILRTSLSEDMISMPSGEKMPLSSNVSLEEAATLYKVVRLLRPTTSAETGFAQGISALSILQALEDNGCGSHHVIDPFQAKWWNNAGLVMAERAGLASRLHFYEKFAEEVVPNLPRLQFSLIDSSHLFDLTIMEFTLIDKQLDVGGVIGFHDLWMASLQKVLRYILSNRSYRLYRLDSTGASGSSAQSLPFKTKMNQAMLKVLMNLPGAETYFGAKLLRHLLLPNLVFIEKTGEDKRNWQFHKPF